MSNDDEEVEHDAVGSGNNGSRHENNKTPLQNEREEEESRRLVNSSSSSHEEHEEGARGGEEEEMFQDHHPCVSFGDKLMWWKGEIQVLTQLAVPSMIINMTFVAPDFLCSSYIGRHYDPVHFSGFALANLTINIFLGTLLQGFFSASDTLTPQAFGAKNYREVGLLAIRGYMVTLVVIVPVIGILYLSVDWILIHLGQSVQASQYAQQFLGVQSLCFPFYCLFMILWKFLSAQHVLRPLVISSLLSMLVVLPLSLQLLCWWLGFLGAAVAITLYYAFQSLCILTLVMYTQRQGRRRRRQGLPSSSSSDHDWSTSGEYHPETWPGLSAWRDALDWKPVRTYVSLGFGAMLAYLWWVYWEGLTLLVGTFGIAPLSAHTIPTRCLDLAYMLPLGMGLAVSIRLGHKISATTTTGVVISTSKSTRTTTRTEHQGSNDGQWPLHNIGDGVDGIRQARALAVGALVVSFIVFGIASTLLYVSRDFVVRLFTTDGTIIALCDEVWLYVCLSFWFLGIYAIVIGISSGLGLQWTLGVVTVVALWGLGVPSAYYFAFVQNGGFVAIWMCIWPPYVVIDVSMCLAFFLFHDWNDIADQVRQRQGLLEVVGNGEKTAMTTTTTTTSPLDHTNDPATAAETRALLLGGSLSNATTTTTTTTFSSTRDDADDKGGTRRRHGYHEYGAI